MDPRTKRFVAHRGANNAAPGNTLPHLPENTLPSMLEAYRVKAAYVECDIHLTKDKQIIVLHDDTIRRTSRYNPDLATTLTKEEYERILDRDVTTLSYNDHVSQVDIGCYDDKLDARYRGTKIPLLSEFLDQLVNHPERKLLVELKAGDKAIIHALTDLIHAYKLERDQLIFISFDFDLIKSLKIKLPDYQHMLLTICSAEQRKNIRNAFTVFKPSLHHYPVDNESDLRKIITMAKEANLDGIDLQYSRQCDQYIPIMHHENLLAAVWTYAKDDNMEMALQMLDAGTDLINTNQPEFIFGELARMKIACKL